MQLTEPNKLLFSDADYRKLMLGQTVSGLGNGVSTFAYLAYTIHVTNSAILGSIESGSMVLSTVLFSIPSGIWADKHPAKRLIMAAAFLGALATLLVIVFHLFFHKPPFFILLISACITGVVTAIIAPAERSLLKRIVSPENMATAMANNQTRYYIGTVGGPLIASLLYGINKISVFVFDFITFVFAYVAFRRIKTSSVPEHINSIRSATYVSTFRFIRSNPVLFAVVWYAPFLNFCMAFALNTSFILLLSLNDGSYWLGYFQSFFGVMGLLGGFCASIVVSRLRGGVVLVCSVIIFCFCFLFLSFSAHMVMIFSCFGIFGLTLPLFNSVLSGYFLSKINTEMVGKASSIMLVTAMAFMPFGTWLSGWIVSSFGFLIAFFVVFCVLSVSSCCFILTSGIRKMGNSAHW